MQRYQTEDEHRKAMRAKINKTIKRGRRRKRIIRRLRKAVPGICIGVLIAGMGAWCIAAPLPDPDDYEPYRFQAENGQWYTQEEYEQMSRERDAYHQQERDEAEKEAQMIRDYQEQYQKDQEAEWKLYQERTPSIQRKSEDNGNQNGGQADGWVPAALHKCVPGSDRKQKRGNED